MHQGDRQFLAELFIVNLCMRHYTSSNSSVILLQSGTGNFAGISGTPVLQSGSYSVALLSQTGNTNTIYGYQNGNGTSLQVNTATVTQASNGNTASYSQTGNSHTVTIHQ
jgi:hypothetical protein